MILEHALLPVIKGKENEFEQAFTQAKKYIMRQKGFISLSLHKGVEEPNIYLLLVKWESVEDHEIGFRQSDDYQKWRKLLHHFYNPFPKVTHFEI